MLLMIAAGLPPPSSGRRIGGLATVPTRIAEAERFLVGKDVATPGLDGAARLCGSVEAGSDTQASAQCRQQLATVMAFRALDRAVERAVGKGKL
jgi:CO/xanthine dehydrogenase FAD-binding subunit